MELQTSLEKLGDWQVIEEGEIIATGGFMALPVG